MWNADDYFWLIRIERAHVLNHYDINICEDS
jgi:hypothetical protein